MLAQDSGISLIVPTYNEAANIQEMLRRAHAAVSSITDDFEIVVVDDRSTDDTAALARAVGREHTNVRVIERTGPRDLALSVIEGWKAAHGQLLAVMDADLQHPPEMLESLLNLAAATGADVAVASRNVRGGGVSEWKLHRRVVSWVATMMAGVLIPGVLRMVRDPMSGFFAVRRDALPLAQLNPEGYKILLEVLSRSSYKTVVELPYVFEERKRGESKLGRKQVVEYLRHVARLSWETGEALLLPKYAAVGLLGVAVNVGVTTVLTHAVAGAWLARAAGFELAVIFNFLLNDAWTFKGRLRHLAMTQPKAVRLGWFQLISLGSLGLDLLAAHGLQRMFGAPEFVASLSGIALGGCTNFWRMCI